MLYAQKGKSVKIESVSRKGNSLYLSSEAGIIRLMPVSDKTVRVSFRPDGDFETAQKPGIDRLPEYENWDAARKKDMICLRTPELLVKVNAETSAIRFYDADGKLLLAENSREPRIMEEFMTFKLSAPDAEVEEVSTADGKKKIVRKAEKLPSGTSFHTWIYFDWQENEELYGLGQHEEGFGSLRGQTVYVHQGNRKIAVPFLVSTLGYGLLIDTYSPLIFNDTPHGSYIYSEAVPEIDYYFMNGGSMGHSVKAYRQLTGKAAMLPKWAFGYIQSKERYENAEELLSTAMEYRSRGIGLDCIVLDWMYWEDGKWGQKSFDRTRFPEPGNMIDTLHKNNVRFMISVWPNMSEQAENRAEFEREGGLMLPCSDLYNAFGPDAEKLYWKQASRGLFSYGVDAWWCDNCEPFAPEWLTNIRPLPHRQFEMYAEQASDHIPAELTNAYALFHTRGICLGQREECEDKRVVILARSGYTGQQRYGSILWSGDIAASWDTLSRQIAAGLGLCASGIPYWTVDIGAFFAKNGLPWYWKGDYDNTVDSAEYRELFVRWYQWAVFLPVFRGHGTDCDRELWQFEDADGRYYDALVKANRLRYEWMPYIYSLAGRTWLDDESMMRYLAFDYPGDKTACGIRDQYMFGDSIMVCPVHEKQSVSGGIKKIYLPAGGWYDLSGNQYYEGGGWIEKMVPLDEIPLFVRAGGILVKTESALSTREQDGDIEVYIYGGADGAFKLYDDDGDGYNYENGGFKTAVIRWEDKEGRLSVTGADFLEGRNAVCCLISGDGSRRTLQISR